MPDTVHLIALEKMHQALDLMSDERLVTLAQAWSTDHETHTPESLKANAEELLGDLFDEDWVAGAGIGDVVHALGMQIMEQEVYAHQVDYAEKNFGKDVDINVGWGVEPGCVTSKIYGHGVLTTWYNADGITEVHFEWLFKG